MGRIRRSLDYLVLAAVMSFWQPHHVYGEELLMALRLNGETVSEGEIVTLDGDKVSLPVSLLRRLRLRIPDNIAPDAGPLALDSLPTLHAHIDRQALVLDLEESPDQFMPSVLQNYVPTHAADRPERAGAFLNYDLLAQDTGDTTLSSGLFSLGAFSDYGVMTSDAVATSTQGVVRLRNYLTQDNGPGQANIVAGDSFLPTGAIGEQFPFGGIQVSSHTAANDPRQISSETLLGQASVPSTLDVYVNDALQSHQSVPTGPFELQNIPVATGDGNIRVVVRDALGQEQVIVRSFYTSPYVLPEGGGDYTYQAGMLRRGYGATSFDYAEPFMSGTQRYGWTKWLTTEFHGEASAERQVIGEQSSFLIAPLGTLRIGGGASDRNGVPGVVGLFGGETDTRPLSFGFSGEIGSRHFTELGYVTDRTTQQSAQVQMNYDLDKAGSLSASFIHLKIEDQPLSDTAAVSYSVNLPRLGFFGVSAFDTLGQGTGAILSFTAAFGDRGTASAQATHDQTGWGKALQATENAPTSGGFGYRALADENASTKRAEAGATYLSNYGEVNADGGVLNGATVGRLNATGSLGLFDGQAFAARATDGNFAMVDTGGIGGIHVMADRQPIGVTSDDGTLVIPHLRPNEVNMISIDPADIPFNVATTQSEKEVVPRNQTGYVVDFGLHRMRTATASIVQDDGTAVPAGVAAKNAKTGQVTMIGNNGLAYLTDLTGDDAFEITLDSGLCSFHVAAPATDLVQPDLGTLSCHIQNAQL